MLKQIGFISFLAFCFLVLVGEQSAAGQSKKRAGSSEFSLYSTVAPPFVTPGKPSFAALEDDQFVVVVTVTCLLEDRGETQVELLSPTPDFVRLSASYRKEGTAIGLLEDMSVLYITPQLGDAGKHVVSLRVKACSGKVERVITFKVKVKPALQD